jgi:uncharacterized spore protein YtfJ
MEAGAAGERPAEGGRSFVTKLTERLGQHLSAKTIYGDPVERDGVTVIPVARARMGFGGGSGSGSGGDGTGEGEGGGGGLVVSPVGYLEIVGGESRFRRINDAGSLVPLVLVGTLAAWVVLRGLRVLLR